MLGPLRKAINVFKADGLEILRGKVSRRVAVARERGNYERWIRDFDTPTSSDLDGASRQMAGFVREPLISILMPVYNPSETCLLSAIESVMVQIYKNWELCIADDCSTEPHVREILERYANDDRRIKVVFRDWNGHISAASNSALELVAGEFTALMDHDDELSPLALYHVAREINLHSSAAVIYSDEDKIDDQGRRYAPFFKPDWSPDMLLAVNYVNHLAVFRTELLRECGGFRTGFEGSQDYDLLLRATERCDAQNILHIPRILYHWRAVAGSVAHASDEKPYAHERARTAIAEHLNRRGIGAKVVRGVGQLHNVIYEIADPKPTVSIIVDGKCDVGRLKQMLKGAAFTVEIVLVAADIVSDDNVRVIDAQGLTRFESLNRAAGLATGLLLCFLDASICSGSENWLDILVSQAMQNGVGAVGPMIIDTVGRIRNAGFVLGPQNDAVSAYFGQSVKPRGRSLRLDVPHNVSAVSTDCLAVRADIFNSVSGFDDAAFSENYGDVDLCMRLTEQGLRNVWTPRAELETAGPVVRRREDELERLRQRWARCFASDPFYNPNLSLENTDYEMARTPRNERY